MRLRLSELRTLIREEVIDAKKRFTDKRNADFQKKIGDFASSAEDDFAKQEQQEFKANKMMSDLKVEATSLISQKKLALSIPGAFDDNDGFGRNASVFDIVMLSSSRDPHWNFLVKFIQNNASAFKKSVDTFFVGVSELEEEFNSWKWPAPWTRYTNWSSFRSDLNRYFGTINTALKQKVNEYRSMAGGGPMRPRRFDVWPEEGYGLNNKPEDDHISNEKFYDGRDQDTDEDLNWSLWDDKDFEEDKKRDPHVMMNNIPNAFATGIK